MMSENAFFVICSKFYQHITAKDASSDRAETKTFFAAQPFTCRKAAGDSEDKMKTMLKAWIADRLSAFSLKYHLRQAEQ